MKPTIDSLVYPRHHDRLTYTEKASRFLAYRRHEDKKKETDHLEHEYQDHVDILFMIALELWIKGFGFVFRGFDFPYETDAIDLTDEYVRLGEDCAMKDLGLPETFSRLGLSLSDVPLARLTVASSLEADHLRKALKKHGCTITKDGSNEEEQSREDTLLRIIDELMAEHDLLTTEEVEDHVRKHGNTDRTNPALHELIEHYYEIQGFFITGPKNRETNSDETTWEKQKLRQGNTDFFMDDTFFYTKKHAVKADVLIEIVNTYIGDQRSVHVNEIREHLKAYFNTGWFHRGRLMAFLQTHYDVRDFQVLKPTDSLPHFVNSSIKDEIGKIVYSGETSVKALIENVSRMMAARPSSRARIMNYLRNHYQITDGHVVDPTDRLRSLIDRIDPTFDRMRINPFLRERTIRKLKDMDIKTLGDIKMMKDDSEAIRDLTFADLKDMHEWTMMSSQEIVSSIETAMFENTSIDDKKIGIYRMRRVEKMTLKDIGKTVGLTRERIRQIDRNIRTAVKKSNGLKRTVERAIEVLFARHSNKSVYQEHELIDTLGADYPVVLHMMSDAGINTYERLKGGAYVIGTSWYDALVRFIEENRDIIPSDDFNDYIDSAIRDHDRVNRSDYESVIQETHTRIEDHLVRRNLRQSQRIVAVAQLCFAKGIRTSSQTDLDRLKDMYESFFEEPITGVKDRAIQMIVESYGVMIGRGLYVVDPQNKELPQSLKASIRSTIEHGDDVMLWKTVFLMHEDALRKENIVNANQLHSMIVNTFKDEFKYSRSYLSKSGSFDFHGLVLKYVESQGDIICMNRLKTRFPGADEFLLQSVLRDCDRFVPMFNSCWLNMDRLVVPEGLKADLKNHIDTILEEHVVSADTIHNWFRKHHSNWLHENKIDKRRPLYLIVKHWFAQDYVYRKTYIGKSDAQIKGFVSMMLELVRDQDVIHIQDWVKETTRKIGPISSVGHVLGRIEDAFVRVDDDMLVRRDSIDLREEDIRIIGDFMRRTIDRQGPIELSKIEYDQDLPAMNWTWNQHLLATLLMMYLPEFKIDKVDVRYKSPVFVVSY